MDVVSLQNFKLESRVLNKTRKDMKKTEAISRKPKLFSVRTFSFLSDLAEGLRMKVE
jgi:hypothetical protein